MEIEDIRPEGGAATKNVATMEVVVDHVVEDGVAAAGVRRRRRSFGRVIRGGPIFSVSLR
jgi:hypothetical protein